MSIKKILFFILSMGLLIVSLVGCSNKIQHKELVHVGYMDINQPLLFDEFTLFKEFVSNAMSTNEVLDYTQLERYDSDFFSNNVIVVFVYNIDNMQIVNLATKGDILEIRVKKNRDPIADSADGLYLLELDKNAMYSIETVKIIQR